MHRSVLCPHAEELDAPGGSRALRSGQCRPKLCSSKTASLPKRRQGPNGVRHHGGLTPTGMIEVAPLWRIARPANHVVRALRTVAAAPAALADLLRNLFAGSPSPIRAQRLIVADPEPLFAFLTDLESQAFLAGRHVEIVHLDGPPGARHRGELRLPGPLGLRRTARARVLASLPPRLTIVRVDVGRGPVALISWTLTPRRGTTEVEIAVIVHSAGRLDRLILRIGGQRLVKQRLETTLAALADLAAIVAEFMAFDSPTHWFEAPEQSESS